jgi:hypothetical protein
MLFLVPVHRFCRDLRKTAAFLASARFRQQPRRFSHERRWTNGKNRMNLISLC